MPSQQSLRKLAVLAVHSGLGLIPGQDIILSADLSDLELARLVAEEAYKAGARAVIPFYGDEQTALIRYAHGSDEAIGYANRWLPEAIAGALNAGTGYLRISSANPSLLKDIEPDKIARSSKAAALASKPMSEAITGSATNWCIIPAASPAWAKHVYPGKPVDEAVEKLWAAIFHITRSDQADPVAAWSAHCDTVRHHMDRLNAARYSAIRFRGPGTDLTVGLADGHVWEGVQMQAKNGALCSPNIPTEEVFTMPHCDRVDGTVSSTKPLSLRGQIVAGIKVIFEEGKITKAAATEGINVLEKLLDTDEGARRLGEIALVPHSSPISQTGLTFYNTLFDENAACHIALGQSYESTMAGYADLTPGERKLRGSNESMIHVDWMIGSDAVDVDGLSADGVSTPIMRGCEWVAGS